MKLKEKINKRFDSKFKKYNWYQTMKTDYIFRALIFSIFGAFLTLCFAIFNGIYGILFSSIWYGTFASYYLVLAIQKIVLLIVYKAVYKKYKNDIVKLEREKQKIYLANGAIFIPLTIALIVIISLLLTSDKPNITGEIMAITIATYTFIKLTMSIRNFIKARILKDKILQSLRNINLAEVTTSIILLESTLITTFGVMNYNLKVLTAISGLVACAIIIGIASYMIISSARYLSSKSKKKL